MTEIVTVPPAPTVPPFPALGAPNFNQLAYDFGSAMPAVSSGVQALAVTARTNAIAAQERASSAAQQVGLAADQVGLAADQVQLAAAQAERASTSALSAAGAANYQGEYDPDKTYTVGQSVSYGVSRFVAKRTVTRVTPVDGADWLLLRTGGGPTLQGDPVAYTTQTSRYQITNFSSFSSYAVSASAGTARISGDTITYTAPVTTGNVSLTLTVDGQPAEFTVSVQPPAPPYIPTPTPTPANFGDPLEGGFYAGMVWNQLAQSATSMDITAGNKTFSVPSMLAAAIVYQGQMVEVRSRANPANKFVGTVTSVSGANLTINVTSIGGSGTYSDWSIMARHRVIVAPKASGERSTKLKNANSALPTTCQTLTEGFAATQAMRDADSSTVYPAAHWARNLDIGGRTDWYIPARDELELCWRNLKPVTNDNIVTANRPTAVSFNYANNGSYGDTANTHGLNNNSAPTGAAYTASVPAQTAAAAFRTGGTEAFAFGSTNYWSSSDYSATGAWVQRWYSSSSGRQYDDNKTNGNVVRAVRRSVI